MILAARDFFFSQSSTWFLWSSNSPSATICSLMHSRGCRSVTSSAEAKVLIEVEAAGVVVSFPLAYLQTPSLLRRISIEAF
jgi:hypothetical protein